jgi:hypothetical protein
MLERGTNSVRVFPVEKRDAATLLALIAANIYPQSSIVSDGWKAYGGINAMQQQYNHRFVNHKLYFVDPADPNVHTQVWILVDFMTRMKLYHFLRVAVIFD